MKLTSLALFASFAVAGFVEAQTAPQQPAQPPTESQYEKSPHHPLSTACRTEVNKLCGSEHGKEMMSCVKTNLDANKFSADCQTELKAHVSQPAKPGS